MEDTRKFMIRVDRSQSPFYLWAQIKVCRILAVSDMIRVFSRAGRGQNSTGWQSAIESLKLRFLQNRARVAPRRISCVNCVVSTSLNSKEEEKQIGALKIKLEQKERGMSFLLNPHKGAMTDIFDSAEPKPHREGLME